jgi:hypothetical protein
MKRATRSSESKKGKKKVEASTSDLRQNTQSKLKVKQGVLTLESDDTDFNYAEFLRTYDLKKEYSDSSNSSLKADKESLNTEESKKEDSRQNLM